MIAQAGVVVAASAIASAAISVGQEEPENEGKFKLCQR